MGSFSLECLPVYNSELPTIQAELNEWTPGLQRGIITSHRLFTGIDESQVSATATGAASQHTVQMPALKIGSDA